MPSDLEDSAEGSREDEESSPRSSSRKRRRRTNQPKRGQEISLFSGALEEDPDANEGKSRRSRSEGKDNLTFTLVGLATLALVLIYGAYRLGHKKGYDEAKPKLVVSDEGVEARLARGADARKVAMEKLDLAMIARSEGKIADSKRLFLEVQSLDPKIPGIKTQLAKIALAERRPEDAENLLLKAITSDDDVVNALNTRASLLMSQNNHARAFLAYADAVAYNPLDPYPYFYWGDSLRRAGRSSEAVDKLAKAKIRAQEQSDLYVIEVKLLLSRIEIGTDPTLAQEIESHLAEKQPLGEWLLAAGAEQMRQNDQEKAIATMERARAALQPQFYKYLLTDGFFTAYRTEPRYAPIFR